MIAGRYERGRLLGSGGMADVYEATDRRLGRLVAVKLLRSDLAADPGFRARFETEARAAARLSHPHVVAVYDTGHDGGRPWIVMERLPGATLADDIARGPLPERVVRQVGLEVLSALGAAHAAGIIHRDVKPGNILWAEDGGVKVGDFGIAKGTQPALGGDLTATNVVIGTPGYLAPERVDGQPATVRSDLWSLGVVLYEALAGTKPYQGATPLAVALAVRRGDALPLLQHRPDMDPGLARAIERAMAMDPEARFGSAEEMAAGLQEGGDASLAATQAYPVTQRLDRPVATAAGRTAVVAAQGAAAATDEGTAAGGDLLTDGRGRGARRTLVGLILGVLLAAAAAGVAYVVVARSPGARGGGPGHRAGTTSTTRVPATTQPPPTTTTTTATTVPPSTTTSSTSSTTTTTTTTTTTVPTTTSTPPPSTTTSTQPDPGGGNGGGSGGSGGGSGANGGGSGGGPGNGGGNANAGQGHGGSGS